MYNPTKNEWDKIPSMNQVTLPVLEAQAGPVSWPKCHPGSWWAGPVLSPSPVSSPVIESRVVLNLQLRVTEAKSYPRVTQLSAFIRLDQNSVSGCHDPEDMLGDGRCTGLGHDVPGEVLEQAHSSVWPEPSEQADERGRGQAGGPWVHLLSVYCVLRTRPRAAAATA